MKCIQNNDERTVGHQKTKLPYQSKRIFQFTNFNYKKKNEQSPKSIRRCYMELGIH